ncbi:MAG: glucosaminidase domain-containing protein [Bacteroidota bacterium]|nr:glucosaminidase domain-containing protein [Bacteroidota bacterium]
MIIRYSFVLALFLSLSHPNGFGQNHDARADYIKKYADLAVEEMKKSGIPASITMAQALLESNNGISDLAFTARNHFGIKCHKTWTGRRFYYDDDNRHDCFRVYKKVKDSYRDHSLFLMTRPRYASLFELDPKDYKAWARGLKAAGYATNPKYADMLITIVEDNNLDRLDSWIPLSRTRKADLVSTPKPTTLPESIPELPIYTRNRIKFVVADSDDTVEKLTAELNKFRWEIRKYNEIPRRGEIQTGQIVYLQPKRNKAARGFDIHWVQEGDSWYSIAQHYGIKLKRLYKRNHVQPGTQVEIGEKVYLRGKNKKT